AAPLVTAAASARPATPAGCAVEHGHHPAQAADRDFGGVAVVAVLVLPLAGPKLAFDVDLAALAQIAFGHADQAFGLQHDRVPLRPFLALPGLPILPAFRGRDTQVGNAAAILEAFHFRVLAEIADQDDLVDAACHGICFPLEYRAG